MASGSMAAMGGASAVSFIVPLLAGISLLMFGLTLAITMSPNEAEIHEDAILQHRMDTEFAAGRPMQPGSADTPFAPSNGQGQGQWQGHGQWQGTGRGQGQFAPRAGTPDAFTPVRRSPRDDGGQSELPPRRENRPRR
jgi:hypothetical protein